MKTQLTFATKILVLAMLAVCAGDVAAQSTPPIQLNIRPIDARAGEPVTAYFGCPTGGLDRIDERRTRVRMVNGTIRMELHTKPDDSFGFCDQVIRLGWLPEGVYGLELWFDGVLSGQRSFSVAPPDPIPEGERGPAYNFSGTYTSPNKPGRNATIIQSAASSTLAIILTGYDIDRSSAYWLLICERWVLPRECVGTVYASEGDPHTVRSSATTAELQAIGTGTFRENTVTSAGIGVGMTVGGQTYADFYVPLRF